MAGALTRGLMGESLAEAVIVPFKARNFNIMNINKISAKALHVL